MSGWVPFVSCICVTRGRPKWLGLAVEYFLKQTFADAELIIVSDSGPPVMLYHPRIRIFNLEYRPATLGDKRNIACEKAQGTVIANWDDDDYSSPGRLDDQLLTMKRAGVSVTAYNKMKFTDGFQWWLYDGIVPNIGIGSSLMFTKAFWERHHFPGVNVAEDSSFVHYAWKERGYVALPGCAENVQPGLEPGDRMYATIHPANTSPRDTSPTGAPNYRQIGQKYAPGRVIDAFRASGAVFGADRAAAPYGPPDGQV